MVCCEPVAGKGDASNFFVASNKGDGDGDNKMSEKDTEYAVFEHGVSADGDDGEMRTTVMTMTMLLLLLLLPPPPFSSVVAVEITVALVGQVLVLVLPSSIVQLFLLVTVAVATTIRKLVLSLPLTML